MLSRRDISSESLGMLNLEQISLINENADILTGHRNFVSKAFATNKREESIGKIRYLSTESQVRKTLITYPSSFFSFQGYH